MNGTRRFVAAAVLFEAALLIVGLTWVGPLARGGEAPPVPSEQEASGGEVGQPQALSVHLGDLFIEPTSLSAKAGTPIMITIHNGGGTGLRLTFRPF